MSLTTYVNLLHVLKMPMFLHLHKQYLNKGCRKVINFIVQLDFTTELKRVDDTIKNANNSLIG